MPRILTSLNTSSRSFGEQPLARGIEGDWYRRSTERRRNGEWFELKTQDVSAFWRPKIT